jgi:hypothetical protein
MSEGISALRPKPKPLNNKGEKAIFGGEGGIRTQGSPNSL